MLQQMKSQVSFTHRIGCQTPPFTPESTIFCYPLLCYSVFASSLGREKNSGVFNMVSETFISVHLDAFQFISVQWISRCNTSMIRKVDTIL